jgi:G3E family GTPase
LINEFGEISLDHLIVGAIEGEAVVLRNGCICCALREDLKQALADLLDRAARRAIPPFRRVVVETTGLADPVAIAQTLLADPMLSHQFRLVQTVTTVDAVLGAEQLRRHPESVRQVVLADRVVNTKGDLASETEIAAGRSAVARINPGSRVSTSSEPGFDPIAILAGHGFDPRKRLSEAVDWLDAFEDGSAAPRHHHAHGEHGDDHGEEGHDHAHAIRSLSLRLVERLDWTAFAVWLTATLHRHGEKILRVKGILDISDVEGPVILQGVQHIIHPPVHLPAWPDGDRASRIVFITDGIDPDLIRASLETFLSAAAGGPPQRRAGAAEVRAGAGAIG